MPHHDKSPAFSAVLPLRQLTPGPRDALAERYTCEAAACTAVIARLERGWCRRGLARSWWGRKVAPADPRARRWSLLGAMLLEVPANVLPAVSARIDRLLHEDRPGSVDAWADFATLDTIIELLRIVRRSALADLCALYRESV